MKPKLPVNFKIFILLLWIPIAIKAQVAPELSQKFSANVLTRIYEVTAKVKLPLEKQIQLGLLFKRQDSLANDAIAKNVTPAEVKKYFTTRPEDLSKILSPFELNDYTIAKDGTASKFAVAIKYREQLGLNKFQVDSLFMHINIIKSGKKTTGTEIKKYEAEHLTQILKKEQYFKLLLVINRYKTMTYATDSWHQLKQLGLVANLDSTKEVTELLNYQTNKITSIEYTATVGEAINNTAIAKPLLLQKLDVINGNVSEKELAAAVKYHEVLKLTNRQVDAIVNYAMQLENWSTSVKAKNDNAKVDTKKNELTLLLKILKPAELYDEFLNLKNEDKAKRNALSDWVDLKKFNLLNGKDSASVVTENLRYERSLLVSVERMANSSTPEKADSVKKAIAAHRPQILLMLAAYRKALPKSQFADAIAYRKELTLDNDQTNQLLDKSCKLEILKLDNKAHGIPEFTNAKKFEGANLITILSEQQYSRYLFFMVQNKGRENAKKDWAKLKQFGIAKGLDSAKVQLEAINYETNMLVAIERVKNDNSQMNVFFKKGQEDKKPEYLKQLDVAVKNLAANEDAKKSITW